MSGESSRHDGISSHWVHQPGGPSRRDAALTIGSREVRMVVLYFALLLVLALVQIALRWRVARLEKRYVRVASEADALLKQVGLRPGNGNRADPLSSARQQF